VTERFKPQPFQAHRRPAVSDARRAERAALSTAPQAAPRRCWTTSDPLYNAYHDEEWGRPVVDERGLLERLCLEGFQSGLSWLTILRKRDNFRAAFADFDPERVARFGARDVKRLLADAGIVRHRGKIEAAIANARGTLALREQGTPLEELVWSYRPVKHRPPAGKGDWQASTPESVALSKALKRAGFRFVGPTTVYAAMQACGVVNDHLAECFVRKDVELAIRAAPRPERPGPAG
jgi:DNA-3-methyladenine glycosylase I